MDDLHSCIMGSFIVCAYAIYMTWGPGGDGVIFGSVIGALCLLAGHRIGQKKGEAASSEAAIEYPEY